MPTLSQLFLSILLPAIVCGIIYITAVLIRTRSENNERLLWLTAIALVIGYLIGYIGIEGKFTIIPKESIHWFFYLTLFALLSSTYWDTPGLRRTISQVIYSILIPRILLAPLFTHSWGTFQGIIWWICISLGVFVFWHIVKQSITAIESNAYIPFIYFGISGGTALILALSGSLRLAQHAGVLTALFVAIWISTIILKYSLKTNNEQNFIIIPVSITPFVIFIMSGIWMNGYFFAEVPWISIILLAVSPLLAQVRNIPAIQKLQGNKSLYIQVGLIAFCVCIAIIFALLNSGLFSQDTYGRI